jgi:hypothetical protein
METDILNTLVTDAIWRAEELDALGIQSPSPAWRDVSALEEELAKAFPATEFQGQIARRGAVRAALKAGDYDRAQALADAYIAEEAAPTSLKASLSEILEEADRAMESRFQHAAKHHTPREARDLARHFREAGPFGLAA